MSSSNKPLVVVTGATGSQGGSVVKFLLKDGGFRVRGVTRNVESPAAKHLAAKGVEVVRGDLDDPASIKDAFNGADAVFAVTNYWGLGKNPGEKEEKQGKTLVDAAKATGVKHFIWSTLDHTEPIGADHWDSKARVNDYLKASGIPHTSLYTSFYFENFLSFFKITKADDGGLDAKWPIMLSNGPIGAYSVEDTGAWVLEILKNSQKWLNEDFRVISEIITPRGVVNSLQEISGKNIRLHEVDEKAFEALKGTEYHEMYTNNKWFYVNNGNPGRDFKLSKSTHPQMKSFKTWAQTHVKDLIPQ